MNGSWNAIEIALLSLPIGIVATVGMDLGALVAKHGFKIPTTDWAMVGRWFGHMRHGVFVHRSIGEAEPVTHELAVGWAAHYAIGIVYAFIYLWVVIVMLSRAPSLTNAVVFGIATVAAPWLIMQPGLGLGIFASKSPDPKRLRLLSLSMHTIFGVSLFIGWVVTEPIFRLLR